MFPLIRTVLNRGFLNPSIHRVVGATGYSTLVLSPGLCDLSSKLTSSASEEGWGLGFRVLGSRV